MRLISMRWRVAIGSERLKKAEKSFSQTLRERIMRLDFLFTSDEETAYADDTEQEEEEPHERWTRMMRGFGALLFPIMVSAGLGAYLAHLHGRKPPQAWFWGSDKRPEIGPTELKRNELKGRCKAVQYPGNEPCQDRLAC
eukprot:CAMPEP_0170456494 /NCGR_PEP_ID=MMETSP0123-20130129/4108_1 /TAXON_ID=182087 /ORGANISM="Favella ehrenbergii, Strain Fehren 1" /LENGTH=139 /DNA_ID=CAMNT_0010719987 /DNA_START=529 /DNA_END=951 /DNA_ORIENTATION=+